MLLGVPKAKADMSDVKILSYSTYVSPADSYTSYAGDFIVVGEIQNQGTEVFDLPQITATAYTSDGDSSCKRRQFSIRKGSASRSEGALLH